MSENDEKLSGPGAGLHATGRTAEDFTPGEEAASDYGDPGETGAGAEEEDAAGGDSGGDSGSSDEE